MESIKVFLSSTFTDEMRELREKFRQIVVNEINRYISQIKGRMFYFDFEFGIPKESGKIYSAIKCLKMVRDSNVFCGIIGNNYGSPITESELKEYIDKSSVGNINEDTEKFIHKLIVGKSVLNLEFDEALVNENIIKLFYIDRSVKTNKDTLELIKKIKESGIECKEFRDANDFKQIVLEDIKMIINQKYGFLFDIYSEKEKEYNTYYTYLAQYYIHRPEYSSIIEDYLSGYSTKPLVIYGEKGYGKSTLISECINNLNDKIVIHYHIGLEKKAIRPTELIKNLIEDYKKKTGRDTDFIIDEEDFFEDQLENDNHILDKLHSFLTKLGEDNKEYFLIVDSFELLDGNGNVSYWWLPNELPANVKFIVVSDICYSDFIEKSYLKIEVKGFDTHSFILIKKILSMYGKEDEYTSICDVIKEVISSPLMIIWMVHLVIFFDKYDTFDQSNYLKVNNINALSELFIDRLESTYSSYGKNFIGKFLSLIHVSRNGITLDDINQYFDNSCTEGIEYLYNNIYYIFIEKGGLINFAYSSFSKVIEDKYFVNSSTDIKYDNVNEFRREYIGFFKKYYKLNLQIDKFSHEIPWQLEKMGCLEQLFDVLCNVDVFYEIYSKNPMEFHSYLNKFSIDDIIRWYIEIKKEILNNNDSELSVIYTIALGSYLFFRGMYNRAEEVYYSLLKSKTFISFGVEKLLQLHDQLAVLSYLKGDLVKAENELCLIVKTYKESNDIKKYPYTTIHNYAQVLVAREKYKEALEFLNEAYEKRLNDFGKYDPVIVTLLMGIGIVLCKKSQYDEAIIKLEEALEISKKIYIEDSPQMVHIEMYLNKVYLESGRENNVHKKIEKTIKKLKRIHKDEYNPDLIMTEKYYAEALGIEGSLIESINMYESVIYKAKQIFGPEHRDTVQFRINLYCLYVDYFGVDEIIRQIEKCDIEASAGIIFKNLVHKLQKKGHNWSMEIMNHFNEKKPTIRCGFDLLNFLEELFYNIAKDVKIDDSINEIFRVHKYYTYFSCFGIIDFKRE